jgi:hypothetical protein
MMPKIVIHHFEDEPENVVWIPKVLRNYYDRTHPDWIVPRPIEIDDSTDDDHYIATFFLRPTDATNETAIQYHVYRTKELFRDCSPAEGDLIILDIMNQNPDGDFTPDGLELLERFERLEGITVLILTGYPHRIPEEKRNMLGERLIVKPPAVDSFIEKVANTLEVDYREHS